MTQSNVRPTGNFPPGLDIGRQRLGANGRLVITQPVRQRLGPARRGATGQSACGRLSHSISSAPLSFSPVSDGLSGNFGRCLWWWPKGEGDGGRGGPHQGYWTRPVQCRRLKLGQSCPVAKWGIHQRQLRPLSILAYGVLRCLFIHLEPRYAKLSVKYPLFVRLTDHSPVTSSWPTQDSVLRVLRQKLESDKLRANEERRDGDPPDTKFL